MADLVLLRRVHLSKGLSPAQRHEYRVVAKAAVAPRRPGQRAGHLAAEELDTASGPGESEDGDEYRIAVLAAELLLDPLHRDIEILGRPGPARRVDPRSAAERRDDETGIVGQCGHPARFCRGCCLQHRIGLEAVAGFVGLGDAERDCGDGLDRKWRQQRRNFLDLAPVMAGNQQPIPGELARVHTTPSPSAARWCLVSSATPARASRSISAKSASSNGAPSAVAWISTIPPVAVSTKFASVCACESSA